MEPERALHLDFLGNHHILRNGHIAAEAKLNHGRAGFQRFETRTDGSFISGRLELNVEITLVCRIGGERIRVARHIDDAVGADGERLLQNRIHDVGRDDFPSPMSTGGNDRQRTDRPTAGDQNTFVGQCAGAVDAVQRYREGFGHGRFMDGDAIPHLVALVCFGDEALAECTLNMRHGHGGAIKAHVQALVLLALQAEFAMVAGPARRYGNTVANSQTGNPLSQSLDGTGHLMAKDHRLTHAHGAETAVIVIMQVGAADAARLDGDLDLSRAGLFVRPFLDPQILRRVDDNRFHSLSSHEGSAWRLMPPGHSPDFSDIDHEALGFQHSLELADLDHRLALLVGFDVTGLGIFAGLRKLGRFLRFIASDNDETIGITDDNIARIDDLTADDHLIIDRGNGLLNRALDADAEREDRETEVSQLQRVAHAGIGHQAANTLCEAGIGENVAERTGFFIFAGGNDDDVARLGIVDGKLQHDVVARRTFDREGRTAELHAIIDRLQPG
ncbi:hypothetical protein D3C80_304730 [compost metagenome]